MKPLPHSHPQIPYTICVGVSMYPTLKAADILTVEPYRGKEIRPGDVAVFRRRGSGEPVVHRIIAVDHGKITTRGDNNDWADSFVVQPTDIVGKVVAAGQGTYRRQIQGGPVGRVVGSMNRIRRAVSTRLSMTLHGPYRQLSRSGVLTRLLPRNLRPRVVCFNRPNGAELHLFVGKRAIGVRRATSEVWQIDRPFRLFIDEAKLPDFSAPSIGDWEKRRG